MRTWMTVSLVLCLAALAGADVIPPGEKPVAHQIFIAGTEAFPDYEFFVGPTTMAGELKKVIPGQALSFYKFAAPLLWAVKKPVAKTPTLSELQKSTSPRSEKPFFMVDTLPVSDPTTNIRTTYTVTSIEDGVVHLERAEKRSSLGPEPSDRVLALLALLGALGLVILAGRSR